MTVLVSLVNLSNGIHLFLSQTSCIASGLALLEDEKNFKLGGCLSDHEMLVSYANMSEYMREITMLTPYLLTKFHAFSVYSISRAKITI
jgi:hypothetical protein